MQRAGVPLAACLVVLLGGASTALGVPRSGNPLLLADRAQVLPILSEEKREREALHGEFRAFATASRQERRALEREIVTLGRQIDTLRFEIERDRYESAMTMRLLGSIAILLSGVLLSLIVGLWQSVRALRTAQRPRPRRPAADALTHA